MRSRLAFCLLCLTGLSLSPARAMQFDPVTTTGGDVILAGRGPIVKGDAARLEKALAAVPHDKPLAALALDSPGGNVEEGKSLSDLIRARALPVVIPSSSKCISACFLLFAASPRRLAASDALVGVHSASEDGQETRTSLAVTTLMARIAADLGVPPAIIGKMVQTTPQRIEWLTRADLDSMNVSVYDGDGAGASPAASRAVAGGPAPAASPPPGGVAQATAAPGFAAGRDDRRAWDAWIGTLRGPYRDGAVFVQARLGQALPASCDAPAAGGEFTQGCETARGRLAEVDARMHGNPDYLRGWNGAAPVAAASDPGEIDYQGVYYCGRQVASLSLKLYPPSADPRQRALFQFGPKPTSPEVPHGAFIVEGTIDLTGGTMILAPVRWVTQPAGYPLLGLSGRSADAGRTFSGRVTDSAACSLFTLRRVGSASGAR